MNEDLSSIENCELGNKELAPHFKFKYSSETQIAEIIRKVNREKQNRKDEENWKEYCEEKMVSPITGGYVVKDSYPSIVFPKNSSHSSLFISGAITIISNDESHENLSESTTNTSTATEENIKLTSSISDEKDIPLMKYIHETDSSVSNENKIDINIASNEEYEENKENKENEEYEENENNDNENNELQFDTKADFKDDENSEKYLNLKFLSDDSQIKKMRVFRQKINNALDNISKNWNQFPEPDGVEDMQRRQKRAEEFASRFSRNYLYLLGRQMNDLRKTVKGISPRLSKNLTQPIFGKFANAHNLIFQGLEAYIKHLPSSIPGGLPKKLEEFLTQATELWRMCLKCEILKSVLYSSSGNDVFVEDIDMKCRTILQNIQLDGKFREENNDSVMDNDSQSISVKSKAEKKTKKLNKKKKMTNRLSMYTVDSAVLLKPKWKRKVKAKYNLIHQTPKSKNSSIKDQSVSGKKSQIDVQILLSQESGTLCKKNSDIALPPREDDIETQMDILSKKEIISMEKNSKKSQLSKEEFNDKLRPLLIEILHNIDNNKQGLENEPQSYKELKTILTDIKHVTAPSGKRHGIGKHRRSKTTTVGSKNAKLICLTPVGSEENLAFVSPTVLSPTTYHNVSTNTSEVNVTVTKERSEESLRKLIPVSGPLSTQTLTKKRSPKVLAKIKTQKLSLLQSVIRGITRYKDQYWNYARKNNMYCSRRNIKPWELVSKISDGIIHELLLDVTKELEMDRYFVKLYEMEFK